MLPEYRVDPRVQYLIDHFEDDIITADHGLRYQVYERVMAEHAAEPKVMQIAHAYHAFLLEKDVTVLPHDLLAGQLHYYGYATAMPLSAPKGVPEKQADRKPMLLNYENYEVRKEMDGYFAVTGKTWDSPEGRLFRRMLSGRDHGLYGRYNIGHNIAGYERVLTCGFSKLIEEGEAALAAAKTDAQRAQIRAMLLSDRAVVQYIRRYADSARRAMATAEPMYQDTLRRIAEACEQVAEGRPETFFQAVQLLLLVHDAIICESVTGSLSLGRLDQILYPYYAAELRAGTIDFDGASVLIDALWVKFAQLMQGFQNVCLGGCDENGRFAGNDLTVMALRASRKTMFDQPLVSFRYHPDMDDGMWNEVQDLIDTGLGFPALFNDAAVIPAKIEAGAAPEHAWRYGVVGCVEPSLGGLEYSNTEELRVNWAKVLDTMLSGGMCSIRGDRMPIVKPRDLGEIQSFEEFYRWYQEELAEATRLGIRCANLLDSTYAANFPVPFMSSTMTGCYDSGKDVSGGGGVYHFSSLNSCGVADAVDSLMAIRELVYERKLVTLPQLAEICRNDFEGHEGLRLLADNLPCRFGNDDPETDRVAQELTNLFFRVTTEFRNPFGSRWQMGLYTVDSHSFMGEKTGALPDGRHRGLSLANGMSPCQGADRQSPTAVVLSSVKLPQQHCGNGLVLDMKFNPAFLKQREHRLGVRELIRTYFALGGLEIQFNVVSRETLLAAKADPQKYRNLVVRVSGFSAYFYNLSSTLQDEIIARTEYAG
ncbi:MAG: hypothetical protein E7458_05580 [Ruminococcaceae bacterium]|nr:hypothetical protein [Oscillospiraceae bacterium]